MKNKHIALLVVSLLTVSGAAAQNAGMLKDTLHFKTAATFTNNGISLIPSFTLGKPAFIFDLSLGKRRLYFEPQLRFSAGAKPWSFIFWWRYKIKSTGKFRLAAGVHPSLVFRSSNVILNGKSSNIIQSHRYLAGEIVPQYHISSSISIGLYYLYSHGLDEGAVLNTHFLTVNSNISGIKLYKDFFARFNPQLYWLRQDGKKGYYFTAALTLGKKDFPVSLQSIINKPIQTAIVAGSRFVWNTSIIYNFSKNYAAR